MAFDLNELEHVTKRHAFSLNVTYSINEQFDNHIWSSIKWNTVKIIYTYLFIHFLFQNRVILKELDLKNNKKRKEFRSAWC